MPKPAKPFETLHTSDHTKALELIGFPIVRGPIFIEEQHVEGHFSDDRWECIWRPDPRTVFAVLSKDYQLVHHETAFKGAISACESQSIPYELRSVSLDHAGAKLVVSFKIGQEIAITPDDLIRPELVLVNSYDSSMALGFDVGYERLRDGTVALSPLSTTRIMHLGTTASPDKLHQAALKALKDFRKYCDQYQLMARTPVSHEAGIRVVAAAVRKNVIPKKLEQMVLESIAKLEEPTVWTVMNAFFLAISQFKGSPTRIRELKQKVARAFREEFKHLFIERKTA
jgi:hypothetical protein